jgi:hypothetical protein
MGMQTPEYLTVLANVGAITITVNQVPADWQIGMFLLLDASNSTIDEQVTITSISGLNVGITALVNSHTVNAPLVNITQLAEFIGPASRWFDGVTNTLAGFGYESVTEVKMARINNDGYITVPLSKPLVLLANVTSATFQPTPLDPVDTLVLTQGWIVENFYLDVIPTNTYAVLKGLATITYMGGYSPMPLDITQAVTVMAARFYKEKDSGYSDVVGSAEMGTFSYKKAMPLDVKVIVDTYTRWVI